MYSCVGFHVVSKIGIQFSMRNISEDKDNGTTSRLEDIVKSWPHVISRPLVDYVVVGQDNNCPLAVVRGFANGICYKGWLWEICVVETNSVAGFTMLQLGAENLSYKMLVLDTIAHVCIVHFLMFCIWQRTRVSNACSPLWENPHLKLRSEIGNDCFMWVPISWVLLWVILVKTSDDRD